MALKRFLTVASFAVVTAVSALPLIAQTPQAGNPPQSSASSTARQILGPPRGVPLSGDALEQQASHVGSLLRCPVCQGLSIDDSPAPMARNMSLEVRDLLAAGYDQEQVLQYFESSYGEFVLLQPPLRGVNWLVWLAPALGLIAGGVAVWFAMKRMTRRPAEAETVVEVEEPSGQTEPEDPEMQPYLAMVRGLTREDAPEEKPRGGKGI